MSTLKEIVEGLRSDDAYFGEALNQLDTYHPERIKSVWSQFMWDKSKRSLLVLQRLGYKLNPIAVLNRELHNKRLVGLLTKEEERELLEKRAREVSIYMAKEAGIPLSEEDLQFDREQELYDENSSTHELDEHEVKTGETWDSQRFAWLLEMHERYEQNLVTLLYEGKLTPPEQAAIDYKLPKQRPLSDNP